jgi:hypothetical protein
MQDASKMSKRYKPLNSMFFLLKYLVMTNMFIIISQATGLIFRLLNGLKKSLEFKGEMGEQNGSLRFELTWTSLISQDWPSIHLG